jgi:hypothetical protein
MRQPPERRKAGQKAGKRSVRGCEGVVGPLQGAILPISAGTGGYGISPGKALDTWGYTHAIR